MVTMGSGRTLCGELMLRRKLLTRADLERALIEQGRLSLPLASTVLKLGWADEQGLVSVLAEQFGVPGVDLGASTISASVLSMVPLEVARSHHILPLSIEQNALMLATSTPDQRAVLDEISFATGREVLPYAALRVSLDGALEEAYAAKRRGDDAWRGARAQEPGKIAVVVPQEERAQVSLDVNFPPTPLPELDPIESSGPPRPADAPPRVLAVDDEEAILDIIDRALAFRGIQVLRATRGRQALEVLRAEQPDVVLLDAMLPEMHGFEICSKIKSSDRYRDIPVMIISAIYTGWNFAQDVKRLYGADDYLAKPFRVVELVRRVEALLERTKARPQAPDLKQASRVAAREAKKAAELYQQGKLESALEAGQRAVAADPFDARAHFMLGSVYNAMGHIYQAISEFERVIELGPTMFAALKNLAVLYEREGFRAKAVEMWTRALEQSPNDAVRQTIKAHLIGLL